MQAIIKTSPERKLIGKRIQTCIANDKTFELWKSFMPHHHQIKNKITEELISMQVFPPAFDFSNFNIQAEFEKWATAEVSEFQMIPEGMETYIIPSGLYAVFLHKGPASDGQKTFQYIFGTWLPNSIYALDSRPHFEILGEKYKNNDPDSEEEIWVPIKHNNDFN